MILLQQNYSIITPAQKYHSSSNSYGNVWELVIIRLSSAFENQSWLLSPRVWLGIVRHSHTGWFVLAEHWWQPTETILTVKEIHASDWKCQVWYASYWNRSDQKIKQNTKCCIWYVCFKHTFCIWLWYLTKSGFWCPASISMHYICYVVQYCMPN